MKRAGPSRAFFLPLLVLAGFAGCDSGGNWQTFQSKPWKFSAKFPGTVNVQSQQTFAEFQAVSETSNFRIMCSQVPALTGKKALAELLAMRDGSEKDLDATLGESTTVDVQGNPAIEFTLAFTVAKVDMVSHTRYVRCRNRFYQLIVTVPAESQADDDIRTFFESFRIEN